MTIKAHPYIFNPCFYTEKEFNGVYSIKDIEKEIGVYSATPKFVRKKCGDIANFILDQVPHWYYEEADSLGLYPNVDVRIHRLYPGDYPAYPGWHCDGEYRETYFSQPDLNKIKVHKHIICTVSSHEGGVSNTRFLNERFGFACDKTDSEHTLWGQVNEALKSFPDKSVCDTKDGQLIIFDSMTLHKAMPTKTRGWRIFFRMSMWHKPNLGKGGMITKQEQVYKLIDNLGW